MLNPKYKLAELVRILEERDYIFPADPAQVTESLHHVDSQPEGKILRRAEMIDSIKAGDQVLLAGGIFGEVVSVKDDQFVVKIADNVRINVVKTAVSTVVGKDEQK